MPRSIDPDTIGFLVTDLSRLIRAEMDRRIADAGIGLTPGEGRALAHAARAGSVRQNVLAERMGVEAMTLSAYLDRLEARGLILRSPDPRDRRAKLVRLTEAAGPVLDEVMEIGRALRADAAGAIAGDEWARLIEMLKTVRANLAALKCGAQAKHEGAEA